MHYIRTIFVSLFIATSAYLSAEMTPAEKLSNTVAAALDVVYGECCEQATLEDKQEQVRNLIESNYDLTVLIRRAIGRNWNLMNSNEQAQVVDLVKRLVVKAYVKGMDGKARPVVTFGETVEISDKRLEVPSTVLLDEKPVRVLYRLGRMESGWQIYDIVAEDISVVSNFRQQFDDHFRKGNGAGLITKLEELLQKDDLDENTKI